MTTSLTLDQVKDMANDHKKHNRDLYLPIKDMAPPVGSIVNGRAVLNLDTPEGPVQLSEHAANQLAARVEIPAAVNTYLLNNGYADEVTAIYRRNWTGYQAEKGRALHGKERETLLRLHERSDGQIIGRALLSDRYGIRDNMDVLRAIEELPWSMARTMTFREARFTPDGMRLYVEVPGLIPPELLNPSNPLETHFARLLITNNEVGSASTAMQLYIERLICTNGMTRGVGNNRIRLTHKGTKDGGLDTFQLGFSQGLKRLTSAGKKEFETYWNLRDIEVEDTGHVLMNIAPIVGLGQQLAQKVCSEPIPEYQGATTLQYYTQQLGSSAYAIVNSLTAYANRLEDDKKTELQRLAGDVIDLSRSKWLAADAEPTPEVADMSPDEVAAAAARGLILN